MVNLPLNMVNHHYINSNICSSVFCSYLKITGGSLASQLRQEALFEYEEIYLRSSIGAMRISWLNHQPAVLPSENVIARSQHPFFVDIDPEFLGVSLFVCGVLAFFFLEVKDNCLQVNQHSSGKLPI